MQVTHQDLVSQSFSHYGFGCRIIGDIYLTGPTHISSQVQGKIYLQEEDKLVINLGGEVSGEIHGGTVEIHGRFSGVVRADRVIIQTTAEVEGNIITEKLSIFPGALVNISGRVEQPS